MRLLLFIFSAYCCNAGTYSSKIYNEFVVYSCEPIKVADVNKVNYRKMVASVIKENMRFNKAKFNMDVTKLEKSSNHSGWWIVTLTEKFDLIDMKRKPIVVKFPVRFDGVMPTRKHYDIP